MEVYRTDIETSGISVVAGGNSQIAMRYCGISKGERMVDGIKLIDEAKGTIKKCRISDRNVGVEILHSAQVTIAHCEVSGNNVGILALEGTRAAVKENLIRENWICAVAVSPPPRCNDIRAFTGYLSGGGNVISRRRTQTTDGNRSRISGFVSKFFTRKGGCPWKLRFLVTKRGGSLDARGRAASSA